MTDQEKRVYEEKRFWSGSASRYDRFLDRFSESYRVLIERIDREVCPDHVVLEVAAGTGLITLEIARRVSVVYAVDITPEMIAEAKRKAFDRHIENISFFIEDAYELPFEDRSFDTVICANALHNMKEPERALAEMKRVVKESGKAILPTFCHGEGLKSRITSRVITLLGFPGYQRFTRERLCGLVERSGFYVESMEIIREKIPIAFIVATPEKSDV
ncbi:MAG: class I SAM-dependent methyltransferase [Deltaproteobacteria bacterium]|nr:class I SAM-dependent methyltransferase [Candidatus Zymogenaceae bacterium]